MSLLEYLVLMLLMITEGVYSVPLRLGLEYTVDYEASHYKHFSREKSTDYTQ